MAEVKFRRTTGDGIIFSAITVADTKLQFHNDVAVLDLAPGTTYDIYWRIAGDELATLKITKKTGAKAEVTIVEDAIPAGTSKRRNWTLFEA